MKIGRVEFPQSHIELKAEIPETRQEAAEGLIGRSRLPHGCCMLFLDHVIPDRARWGRVFPVVMKGMGFPLDILWIERRRIIGKAIGIEPGSALLLCPGDAVIELPAGTVEAYGMLCGDPVKITEGEEA